MNSVDQKLSSSMAFAVEVRRLQEENARVRSRLLVHRIPISEAAQPTLHPPHASNSAPAARMSSLHPKTYRLGGLIQFLRSREPKCRGFD
jgi:hypothetical protein